MRLPEGAGATWRLSLEEVPGGERHPFASLEDVLAYLRTQMTLAEESEDGGVSPPDEADASL